MYIAYADKTLHYTKYIIYIYSKKIVQYTIQYILEQILTMKEKYSLKIGSVLMPYEK